MVGRSTAQSGTKGNGLRDLFLEGLKDIYWAEKALVKAIPKMVSKASSNELVLALEEHLKVTKTHVIRLDRVFELINEEAAAKKCEAMEGLLAEVDEIMKDIEEGVVRDAGIIAAAQKVEHYEIASYGTLVSFANTLGESDVAELLEETLNDEKEADQLLTEIATSSINMDATGEE